MLALIIEQQRDEMTQEINHVLADHLPTRDEHLVRALWLRYPLDQINKLIEKGASIKKSIVVSKFLDSFDQYPLTIAVEIGLSLEYIKVLDNDYIPPVYKYWLIQEFKPNDDIVLYLLNGICNLMEDDIYIKDWEEHRYNAPFFLRGKKKKDSLHILEPEWNSAPMYQAIARGIRLRNHIDNTSKCKVIVVKHNT